MDHMNRPDHADSAGHSHSAGHSDSADRRSAAGRARAGVDLWPNTELSPLREDWPGMRSRWIIPPRTEGWSDFVLSEWELEKAAWSDLHHHDEVNVVVEGELHVESAGESVVARPGDTVRVPAGQLGRYSAPVYARMITIYGPNPGRPDERFDFEPL